MSTEDEQKFKERLQEIYSKQDKIPPLIEGLENAEDADHQMPEHTMKDCYVKLNTVIKEDGNQQAGKGEEKAGGHKPHVAMENMFEKIDKTDASKSDPTKLLMIGGAGVGKTTFLRYIAYQWSQAELWADKFDFVFRVSLKSILNPKWSDDYKFKHSASNDVLRWLAHLTLSESIYDLQDMSLDDLDFDDMVWPESKDRVLLLLDGYDEIGHLKSDKNRRKEFTQLTDKIFSHKYLIVSSRPNGIDDSLKEKFDRTVETTGLSHEGIKQYFTQYFENSPADGEALEKFLRTNSAIREICKIPVNMAMLCYSWKQSKQDAENNQISSVAGLYGQVLKHLEKRYYSAHKWNGPVVGVNKTLEETLKNGDLNLDEMKVLQHIAYKAFSGGGIEVDDSDGKETLTIPGAYRDAKGNIKKDDEEGISIQSSINWLAKKNLLHQKDRKVNINDVYKYGLLRVEKRKEQSKADDKDQPKQAKEQPKQGKEESDPQSQEFSFIYRTFQEYLTALYFKEKLESTDATLKAQVCQYLAENRNQPRYLMTLKFLAGIITADKRDVAKNTAKVFWDAMACNVDGMIELGVEAKVNLMMHLLGQARIDGQLDERIPNKQKMIDLIDAVVLNDLPNWGPQLKESNYLSENIKEALLKTLEDGSMSWRAGKLKEIQEKSSSSGAEDSNSSSALKEAIGMIVKEAEKSNQNTNGDQIMAQILTKSRVIDTLTDLISGFDGQDEQHTALVKLIDNLKDRKLAKSVGEGLKKIIPLMSFTSEEMTLLTNELMPLASDDQLSELALTTIVEIAKISPETELIDQVLPKVLSKSWSKSNQFMVLDNTVKMLQIKQNTDTTAQTIAKLMNQGCFEQSWTLDAIKKISEGIQDKSLIGTIVKGVVKDFSSTDESICLTFIHAINKVVMTITDQEVAKKSLEEISSLVNNGNDWAKAVIIYAIGQLAETTNDKTVAAGLSTKIRPFLENNNADIKASAISAMIIIAHLTQDTALATKLVELSASQLGDSKTKEFIKQSILNKLSKLFSLAKDRNLNIKLLDQLTTLYDSLPGEITKISDTTISLVKEVKDEETTTYAIEKLLGLFTHKDPKVKIAVLNVVEQVSELSKDEGIKGKALAQTASLFVDEDEKVRHSAHRTFGLLFGRVADEAFKAKELEKINKGLAEGKNKTRFYAGEALFRISKDIKKEELIKGVFEKVSEFLGDNSTWSLRALGVALVVKFTYKSDEQYKNDFTEAVRRIMALIPASPKITDDEHKFFGTVIFAMQDLIGAIEDEELLKDILTKSYLHGNDFECKAPVWKIVAKASQKKSLIDDVLVYVADDKSRWYSKAAVKKYFDLVLKESKKDKGIALDYFEHIPKLISMGTITTTQICDSIGEILKGLGDNTLINQLFEVTVNSLLSEDEEAQKGSMMLLEQLKKPEIKSLLEQKVKPVVKSLIAGESKETTVNSLSKLINVAEARSIAAKEIEKATQIISLFSDGNSEARKCAIKLSVEILKQRNDEEKAAEIIDGILKLVKDSSNLEVQITAIEALPELIKAIKDEKKSTELIEEVLNVLTNARKEENFDVRIATLQALIQLTEVAKDKTERLRIIDHILHPLLQQRSFGNNDLDATKFLLNTCKQLIKNIKNKEEAVKFTQELLGIFTDVDGVFNLTQLKSAVKNYILKQVQKETMAEENDEDEIIKNAENSNAKRVIIRTVTDLLDESDNKPLLSKFGQAVEYKLADHVLSKIVKLIQDEQKLSEIVDLAVRTANVTVAENIVNALGDKKLASHAFKTSVEELSKEDLTFVDSNLSLLRSLACLIEDKELLKQGYQQVQAKFPILGSHYAQEKYSAGQTMSSLSIAAKDENLRTQTVNTLVEYLIKESKAHSKENTVEKTIQATCQMIENKGFIIQTFERLLKSGQNEAVRGFIIDDLLSPEEIIKNLEYSDKEAKNVMIWALKGIFDQCLQLFEKIEELLRQSETLRIDAIMKDLFGNKLEKKSKSQVEAALAKFKEDSITHYETLKNTLVSCLLAKKQLMDHKVIKIALASIGFEGAGAKDASEKELLDVSKRVLDHQLKQLGDGEFSWINENFTALTTLSSESKPFFKKLYHKLIEDSKISPLKQQIIIQCINQGLTTSISRKGEIIFEGKKYKKDESAITTLEEIAKAVIDQGRDTLASQYKLHKPIFMTSDAGMKKAAIDIESVESSIDEYYPLKNDEYLLSRLIQSDDPTKKIVLLEQRSAIGDHMIYNFTDKKYELIRINPTNTEGTYKQGKLEKIFGTYKKGMKYKGKSKAIAAEEGNKLITQSLDASGLDEFIKAHSVEEEDEEELFQQELLGLGITERLNAVATEVGKKLTDYNQELREGLKKKKIPLADQKIVKKYFDAFVSVFASTLTTSQAIDSGKFNLNVSDSKTNAAATLVSFIPFVGAQAANAVKSIGEFMKKNEITTGAKKFLEIAADAVELNQTIGKICCQVLLENEDKLKQVINIKNEDFKSASTAMIRKVQTLFPGLKDVGDMVNGYLNEGDKAPSMKLGRNDANKIVEEWVKGKIAKDNINTEFVKIALTSFVIEEVKEEPSNLAASKSNENKNNQKEGKDAPGEVTKDTVEPPELENPGNSEKSRPCCCQMF